MFPARKHSSELQAAGPGHSAPQQETRRPQPGLLPQDVSAESIPRTLGFCTWEINTIYLPTE